MRGRGLGANCTDRREGGVADHALPRAEHAEDLGVSGLRRIGGSPAPIAAGTHCSLRNLELSREDRELSGRPVGLQAPSSETCRRRCVGVTMMAPPSCRSSEAKRRSDRPRSILVGGAAAAVAIISLI